MEDTQQPPGGDGGASPGGGGIGMVLVGGVLLLASVVLTALIPAGPSEFAYYPHLGAWQFHAVYGITFEQVLFHALRILLATPGLLLISYGLSRRLHVPALDDARLGRVALGVGAVAVCYIGWVVVGELRGRVIVDDALTYSMQADLLLDGQLFFDRVRMVTVDPFYIEAAGGVTGKYLFGEPLVQIPGLLVGFPALGHVVLAGLTLLMLHRALAMIDGPRLAAYGVVLLSGSPMFLLTTATGQSQSTSLFCAVAAFFGYALVGAGRCWRGALLAAAAVGFWVTVRPQAAAPVGAVLCIAAAISLVVQRRPLPLIAGVTALAGFAGAVLAYNAAVTGDPLVLPWYLREPVEALGFGEVVEGGPVHTPLRGLRNLMVSAVRFNGWWLGWPCSLAMVVIWARFGRRGLGGPGRVLLLGGLALVVFNLFYYSPGTADAGPGYYYELLLPGALIGGAAAVGLERARPRLVTVLLAVHLLLGSTGFVAYQHARLQRLTETIHAAADRALEQIDPPALLLYEAHCSESLPVGWVLSAFPRRCLSDRCPVITLPRPPPSALPSYREAYPDRVCWYYRFDPDASAPELRRCEEAAELMLRPIQLQGECLGLRPTEPRIWP